MLNLIRPLVEPVLRKNLFLFNFFTFIYYYAGYIFYIFFKLFKKPYIGGYLFSNQDMGRKRQKTICNILKSIDTTKIPDNYSELVNQNIDPEFKNQTSHRNKALKKLIKNCIF